MKHEKIIDKLDALSMELAGLENFVNILQRGIIPEASEKGDNEKAETSLADFLENSPEAIQILVDRVATVKQNLINMVDRSNKPEKD